MTCSSADGLYRTTLAISVLGTESEAVTDNQSTELPNSRAAHRGNKPRVQFVVFERAMRANVQVDRARRLAHNKESTEQDKVASIRAPVQRVVGLRTQQSGGQDDFKLNSSKTMSIIAMMFLSPLHFGFEDIWYMYVR